MPETIVFNGIKFRRYPESSIRTGAVYYAPGGNHRKRGIGFLHQEVWRATYGDIPAGHHIHHKDGNPLNNDLANLEAVPGGKHLSGHNQGAASASEREHLARIRPLAAEWHRSDAGRAWHKTHGLDVWVDRKPEEHTCERCGGKFSTLKRGVVRFCSNRCKAAWRRAAGVDDEDRACLVCGALFRVNRYESQFTCSRACGVRARSQAGG